MVGSGLEARYKKGLNLKERDGLGEGGVQREQWALKWKGCKGNKREEWVIMEMELEQEEGAGWGNRKAVRDSEEAGMARIVVFRAVLFCLQNHKFWTFGRLLFFSVYSRFLFTVLPPSLLSKVRKIKYQ